jgi:hypothetical protein
VSLRARQPGLLGGSMPKLLVEAGNLSSEDSRALAASLREAGYEVALVPGREAEDTAPWLDLIIRAEEAVAGAAGLAGIVVAVQRWWRQRRQRGVPHTHRVRIYGPKGNTLSMLEVSDLDASEDEWDEGL